MRVFVSYSGRENPAVAALYRDLQQSGHTVWLDHEIRGGETWWEAIVAEIRRCEVFVIAVSEMSMASQACLAELHYARALGKPVLPVLVETVSSLRTLSVADTQIVDYRTRTADTAYALMSAVTSAAARGRPMPHPQPPEPPMPYGYLLRLSRSVDEAQLSPPRQVGLLAELHHTWEIEREDFVRREIVGLLVRLRNRPDITFDTGSEIDRVLAAIGAPPPPDPPVVAPPTPWRINAVLGVSGLLAAVTLVGVGTTRTWVWGLSAALLYLASAVGAIGMTQRRRWGRPTTVVALVVMLVGAVGAVPVLVSTASGTTAAGQFAAAVVAAALGAMAFWMLLLLRHRSVREYVGSRPG